MQNPMEDAFQNFSWVISPADTDRVRELQTRLPSKHRRVRPQVLGHAMQNLAGIEHARKNSHEDVQAHAVS